jgi:DNA-binding winged helix-turn-helix (wHTH) protein/Tfp pilus assembly protein PilF
MRVQFEDVMLDTARQLVTIGDETVHLSPRLFATLEALVRHCDRAVSREELRAAVWPGLHVEPNNVAQAIRGLRRALASSPAAGRLRTLPGRGYLFAGPVTWLRDPPDNVPHRPVVMPTPPALPCVAARDVGMTALLAAAVLVVGCAFLLAFAGGRPSPSADSQALYQSGSSLMATRRAADLQEAAARFRQALAADEGNYDALVALAQSEYLLAFYGVAPSADARRLAEDAAAAAIARQPLRARAYAVRASIVLDTEWDLTASARDFRQAIQLDPDDPLVRHWSAWWCLAAGRMPEARAALDQAVRRDPFSASALTARAMFAYLDRDFDAAVTDARGALQLDPDFFRAHLRLGLVHLATGATDRAISHLETAHTMAPDVPETASALAHAYAVTGRADAARRLLAEHEHRLPLYDRAIVLAGLGQLDEAVGALGDARERQQLVPGIFALEPRLDALHRFAEFQALQTSHETTARPGGPLPLEAHETVTNK